MLFIFNLSEIILLMSSILSRKHHQLA